MPNEVRSNSGTRVDYVKADKPSFDLAAESKKQRAKMGGSAPPSQPALANKVSRHQQTGRFIKAEFDPQSVTTAPHGSSLKPYIDALEK